VEDRHRVAVRVLEVLQNCRNFELRRIDRLVNVDDTIRLIAFDGCDEVPEIKHLVSSTPRR